MNALGGYLANVFLSPAGLALLGIIPIIVLLYLLKLRRTEVTIASTMLWRKRLHDLTANAPFQRLRANLLLFLQILAIVLLAIALARPFRQSEALPGTNHCIAIDRSASMQAIEEDGATRLDTAKEKAHELIDQLQDGGRMMIVSFAESADVLCEFTDDRRRLHQAVRSITPADTRTRIRDVANVVRSLAPDNPDITTVVQDMHVVLLSDGNLADADLLGTVNTEITYMGVGKTRDNAGIVALSVRRNEAQAGERQVFIQLYSDADTPRQTTLSLYYTPTPEAEPTLLAVEEITLPPGETVQEVFALPEMEEGLLRAVIDGEDALAVDNTAWVTLYPETRRSVLIVSDPDALSAYFLRRVLQVDPQVEVSRARPESYVPTGNYGLTIFNGWAPETLPPGALVFVDAPPPVSGLEVVGGLDNPPVLATAREHPLMRLLNPANLRVGTARQVILPEGATPLLTTKDSALMADLSHSTPGAGAWGQAIVYIAFDLEDSNWPLHLSFPLFFQNLLAWIPEREPASQTAIATGESIEIPPIQADQQDAGATATVRTPTGETYSLARDPQRPVYFAGATHAGAYSVSWGGETRFYAANLLEKGESAIAPAKTLPYGRGQLTAQTGAIRYNQEFRWLALGIGLAVLVFEWWLYSRRAWL
ncbi:MAG: vWA domain-containing protein [Candidatus Hydrogenedentota bacterium]